MCRCRIANRPEFFRTVRSSFGAVGKTETAAFPGGTLPGNSKTSVAFCCIINIIRWRDTPWLRPDRPALRHQLARSSCLYAADDEYDRLGTASQHDLIGSSPFPSLYLPFRAQSDLFAVATLLRKFNNLIIKIAHRLVVYQKMKCTFTWQGGNSIRLLDMTFFCSWKYSEAKLYWSPQFHQLLCWILSSKLIDI